MVSDRRSKKGCLRGFLIFTAIALVLIIGVAAIITLIYVNSLPTLEELSPSPVAQTSKVYDLSGSLITEFHAEENREIIPFSSMSDNIKDAIVAVEDKRFFEHQGVDYIRILGAAVADIKAGRLAQGGSTITQQVVKNIYFSPEKTWRRKINEALIAIQLERNYTKDKLLEMYLNTIYFGAGTYGIEKASEVYFGKDAADLSIPEAALLAGMVQAPEVHSPFNNIENAKYRRDLVLKMMYEQEFIDPGQYMDALAEPIKINEDGTGISGNQPGNRLAPYFIDFVKQQLYDQEFNDYDVFKGGLRIYTTLDVDLQEKAEQAVKTVFPGDITPSYSLICTDPDNGYIYALIGGKDYAESKFNIATQGRRQPGSVFKTLVLMESAIQNISAKNEFDPNGPITINMPEGPDWIVNNYGGQQFSEKMSIADAMAYSVNIVYAQLIMDVGAENVEALCNEMDIFDIGSNPAIALGGLKTGITPLDISKVFSTLASGGIYHKPVTILKITDARDNILYQYDPEEEDSSKRILEEPVSHYITRILKKVIEIGTGRGADIGRPAAGKTGTTSDYKDAWFAGYTPELVTIVWMGNSESSEPMEPINDRVVVGGTYPADIWREFMTLALQDSPIMEFESPDDELIDIEICSESGLIPVFWCPEETLVWKIFVKGDEPDDICNIHNKVEVPNVVGLSIEEARPMFEELYTIITEVQEFDDTYNQGIIFDQSPPAGSFLESLTGEKLSVILYVSRGERTFSMPDLTGLKLNNAKNILAALDMAINEIIYEFSDLQPIDLIFGQNPVKDSTVTKSTEVNIYISKGVDPEGEVPDLIGLTEEEAVSLLALSGFENVSILFEESQEEIEKVFSQVPNSGTVYNKEAEIILRISSGIMVPDVIGLELEDAVIMLEDLGFVVIILPDGASEGTVAAQTPENGEYLDYGSSITIEIEEEAPPMEGAGE
ncbi:MAG: PBP1A family penicillin-binding protein [Actinomycetia bacterium]|nr:PBP1A family penicillin-binding protein [Actinomycetes bacterium]